MRAMPGRCLAQEDAVNKKKPGTTAPGFQIERCINLQGLMAVGNGHAA